LAFRGAVGLILRIKPMMMAGAERPTASERGGKA
jgi:hypothetical protein